MKPSQPSHSLHRPFLLCRSKADAVEREHDRQRVLIQITQNLATKIRNSHAFNLPTFYLPRDDDRPSSIPNAINDVCQAIEKAINMTVQHNLKQLKQDCEAIVQRIDERIVESRTNRKENLRRSLQGLLMYFLATLCFLGKAAAGLYFWPLCRLIRNRGLIVSCLLRMIEWCF